ncbi:MAG: 2-C-methyl-D-erythritol 4-phosphate cytidylyltransferase [Planctomycetota bacterium]
MTLKPSPEAQPRASILYSLVVTYPSPSARVVLVAAGSSTRMRQGGKSALRKPWLDLCGQPVLEVTAEAISSAPEVQELVIVIHPDDIERLRTHAAGKSAFAKLVAIVPGGKERADSVRLGARASNTTVDVIAVHDAARPLVEPATVSAAIQLAHVSGAALVAVPVTDTIKESSDGKHVSATLDRSLLWSAQTPQCFRATRFLELLDRAELEGFRPTDDSALWERWVGPVPLVEGSPRNRKITTPADLELARALLCSSRDQVSPSEIDASHPPRT